MTPAARDADPIAVVGTPEVDGLPDVDIDQVEAGLLGRAVLDGAARPEPVLLPSVLVVRESG